MNFNFTKESQLFRSQEGTTATEALPGTTLRRRWGDRCKVGVDLDVGQMTPQSPDSSTSDQLTVVELNAFEIVARDQVVERHVRDEWQVVQLKNVERLRGTRCNAQLTYPFVGD